MKVALVGAELEENLGLRYIASSLECHGHETAIVPFNTEADAEQAVAAVMSSGATLTGLSMIFTSRGKDFIRFAERLRAAGYDGHIIGGGPFASFNCERLIADHPAFDTIALGEGEELMVALAEHLDDVSVVPGLCYRDASGQPVVNASIGNPDRLDALPWPKRTTFHEYFGKRIASVLTSRGCWRDCAFCSINAWYKRGGGKNFRLRSVDSIVAEVADLYHQHGIRIFNFQDDNFFLPNQKKAARRFAAIRDALADAGVKDIAIAVKARPDSITRESIAILDELGLFRVFLGVENAAENGLRNLNRKNTVAEILNALEILNDYDVHIAYNLLMFEPDTTLDEIAVNLRFVERHVENPFNFCRAEAYPGTGLETRLLERGKLLGDHFGYDYRIGDPHAEAFHQIANYAFFDRNFSDFGLHYFNMQVDFFFQLLRRFHPDVLTQSLRASVRNFIKETNLDTFARLSEIYDFVVACDPTDRVAIRAFARQLKECVNANSVELAARGQRIITALEAAYEHRGTTPTTAVIGPRSAPHATLHGPARPLTRCRPIPYRGLEHLGEVDLLTSETSVDEAGWYGLMDAPIPYSEFKAQLAAEQARTGA